MKARLSALLSLFLLCGCSGQKESLPPLLDERDVSHIEQTIEAPAEKTHPVYFDIPLSHDLQDYTFEVCREFDFAQPEIIFALMETESDFNPEAISFTSDYGLLQINPVNLGWLNTQLGITDLLDPEQNIRAGVYMIDQLMDKYTNPHMALMAYNMGEYGALEYWNAGIFHSDYSDQVMASAKELSGCQE